MAVIDSFHAAPKTIKLQPTRLICHWSTFRSGTGMVNFIQLDTRGSSEREMPEKQSQTIQLTRESAKELFEILKAEFEF